MKYTVQNEVTAQIYGWLARCHMYLRTQVESPETYRHPVTKKIFFLAQHTDVLRIYETEQTAAATSGWSHYVDNNCIFHS